jgi:hypothetical protein
MWELQLSSGSHSPPGEGKRQKVKGKSEAFLPFAFFWGLARIRIRRFMA